jgi:hypothetical protein
MEYKPSGLAGFYFAPGVMGRPAPPIAPPRSAVDPEILFQTGGLIGPSGAPCAIGARRMARNSAIAFPSSARTSLQGRRGITTRASAASSECVKSNPVR